MPPLYAYETKEIKMQIGDPDITVVTIENAIEGKEYFCGCAYCNINAKVVFKSGKFKVKYGDSKNHSGLCRRLTRFNEKKFDEKSFNFDTFIENIMKK